MEKVRYMISDAASHIRVESHVLRYWEEELDLKVPRNEMGHRYYTEENLRQFEQIKQWKEEGYSLKAIREMLHSTDDEEIAEAVPKAKTVSPEKSAGQTPTKRVEVSKELPEAAPKTLPERKNAGKVEQFQALLTQIVHNAIADNNQALGAEISQQVEERVLKEMNYLMRDREEKEEERFRKLDEAIRLRQKKNRREHTKKEKKRNRTNRMHLLARGTSG